MIHTKFPAKTCRVKEDKKKLYICTDFLKYMKITNLIFEISDRHANSLAAIIVSKIRRRLNAESTVLSTFFLFFSYRQLRSKYFSLSFSLFISLSCISSLLFLLFHYPLPFICYFFLSVSILFLTLLLLISSSHSLFSPSF